jgi:uncharacterized protein (TIGR03437 family)
MEYKLRNLVIGFTISFSLLALSAQAQTPSFTAATVLNAASMVSGPIAPGMVVAITGSNLGDTFAPHNCSSTLPVPTTCVGISVLVNGAPAPVLNTTSTEVRFQAPSNLTGSTATIQVSSNLSGSTESSAIVTVPVAPAAPGLFSKDSSGTGTGYYFDSSLSTAFPAPSPAVNAGDTVVLYGTGFGATNPAVAAGVLGPSSGASATATVTMTINNQSVPVTFGGLGSSTVGYDDVIFTVPSTLTVPVGQLMATFPMVVTVGGVASQAVNLIVNAPAVTLTAISPSPVPLSSSPQTVTFTGSGFQTGLTLQLEAPGSMVVTTVPGANITVVSATQFTAQITVGTAGTWSAIVADTNGNNSNIFTFPASGTASTGPTITSVVTTSSGAAEISQNAWIEVHGTNFMQGTPLTWSAASFATGLPTTLGGITATVDGKAAAIYYVSPTQVNILAPLDAATGSVPVQLVTPLGTSPTFLANEVSTAPAFLVIDTMGHVAAEHLPNFSLLGPASLDQPGYSFTPAVPGENVTIYTTGFGQTSPALTNQLTNTGLTPTTDPFPLNLATPLPQVTIGNLPATVSFAGLVSPGLYQINLTIPSSAPAGDLPILATYNGVATQSNAVITVQ